ncbi:MAG: SPOR domain-containing protein [Paramuribaculum sp.]|nr:SPOR domain-containing protein [Paramuribaculum sp.]
MKLYNTLWMRTLPLLLAAAAAVSGMTSCKTTEQNYKSAYEVAKARQNDNGGLDSTVYSRLRPQGKGAAMAVGSDSLAFNTVTIGYTADCGASAETVKRYNIVVGQFKQIFNAKAMRKRLIDQGYEGAMVVHTREPLYYVIASSCATPEEALAELRRVGDDGRLKLKEPFPWVLRPSHLAR